MGTIKQEAQKVAYNANEAVRSATDMAKSKFNSAISGLSAQFSGIMNGDVVGIDVNHVPAMKQEINTYIEDLKEHSSMWFRAGGMGGKMAMKAREEISYLEGIVRDLESGTTDFLSSLYEKKLEYLNLIKKGASIFQLKKIEALEEGLYLFGEQLT